MSNIRQIARDPHKALKDLEKELGIEPGSLLRDMDQLAGKGDDWKNHLPYLVAESYYEDDVARAQYEGHVNSCEYCKALLQTLHPSDPQVRDFAEQATAVLRQEEKRARRGYLPAYSVPLAAAASIVLTIAAVLLLQRADVTSLASERQRVVNELRLHPSKLVELQTSNNPAERFHAARYYFAVEQPQLAYRQIGEGLELAGLDAIDTQRITTAADIPRDDSAAPTLALAAQRLTTLKSSVSADREPVQLLELAVAQAKLGFHDQSLKSLRKYLETRNVDPQLLAEFPKTTLAKQLTASTAK